MVFNWLLLPCCAYAAFLGNFPLILFALHTIEELVNCYFNYLCLNISYNDQTVNIFIKVLYKILTDSVVYLETMPQSQYCLMCML